MKNNPDHDQFREKLQAELQRLQGELSTLGHPNPKNPTDWQVVSHEEGTVESDKNELADKFEQLVDDNAILNELEVQYNEVAAALKRIEDGSYGICEGGGEPIPPKRLEAFPAARTCLEHQP
jgi:DnaK suppressor protein